MLVLSRRLAETVKIGDDVVVTVLECRDGRVRLGIEAPRDVLVLRGELAARNGSATEPPSVGNRNP